MHPLLLTRDAKSPLNILCLGAHSDDIEIGCGATVLTLLRRYPNTAVHWVVFSASGERESEAKQSAQRYLRKAKRKQIALHDFRDGFFPAQFAEIKEAFELLKRDCQPDLIFTHARHDRHQDHRAVHDLTWNTWRNHHILAYEIPKYDGDLQPPNVYIPVGKQDAQRKIDALLKDFPTQAKRPWFDAETFWALMRLRGLECNSRTRYAEAFHAHKLVLE